MLINTVILFLQNALPIFIIASLLLLTFNKQEIKIIRVQWLIFALLLTVIITLILSDNLEIISQFFYGKGVELLFSFCLLLVYFCCASLFIFSSINIHVIQVIKISLAFIIFFVVSCLNGAHFIIYLTSYWAQTQLLEPIFIGVVLGGGICLSIAVLLYFLLKYIDRTVYSKLSTYFILLFATGQLVHVIVLLQQVDLLPASQMVWDSSNFISENSELGHLLTVLLGYESTPSALQLITFSIAFLMPLILSYLLKRLLIIDGEKS